MSGGPEDPTGRAARHRTGARAAARPAVHAAAGNRLGAAHPRQEGPTDLRLVPPALAAWATAAVTLDAPPAWTTGRARRGERVTGHRPVSGHPIRRQTAKQ